MAQNKLSLEAPDTLNPCVLRVVDTSIYNSEIVTKCPQLQITPPGFTQSFFIDNIQTEFILNLSACDLKIQKVNCGTVFNNLADGIYIIRYSVSPNDIVFVEYNHLRITHALILLREILCDLDVSGCKPEDKTVAKLQQVREIQGMLLAAKAKVEDCGEPFKGMDIYNYCLKLINKIDCRTCKNRSNG